MKRILAFLFLSFAASVPAVQGATVNVGSSYTEGSPYTVTSGTGDNYVFSDGGWMKANVTGTTFTGTFSGNGTLYVTPSSSRPQVYFDGSLSGFSGKIIIDKSAWFAMGSAAARGSENAAWTVNTTEADVTGLLLANSLGSTAANPVKLGTLEGNGCIRPMGNSGVAGGLTHYVQVGNLLKNKTDSSIYDGVIRDHNGDFTHVEKVGAGTWILTNTQSFSGGLVVSEGTLQLGNNSALGGLSYTCPVLVKAGASFGYCRAAAADGTAVGPVNPVTIQGGTLFNGGVRSVKYNNITFENGGTITYTAANAGNMAFTNLKYTGDEDSRLTIWNDKKATYLDGALTSSGTGAKEIYLTGARGNFLYINGDLSGFTGTITAGPATNGTNGTWISLNSAKDAHNTTFNLMPGKNLDAGLLLDYIPDDTVMQIGALSGNGIVRTNQAGTYKLQIGGNNQSTTFSGGIQTYGSNYTVEKIGTGTWTITSDNVKYNLVTQGYKNNYTGDTMITGGTIQLGDYNPATQAGGATGQLGGDDANNSAKMTRIVISSEGTLAIARNGIVDVYNNIVSNDGHISVVNPNWDMHVALRGATSGHIIKTGAGALALGANNGDKLTKITIQEGALENWAPERIAGTEIEFNGGTFLELTKDVTLGNTFTLTGNGTIRVDENLDYTISGAINGAGNLTKTGVGTLYLTGGNNYTGRLTVEAGTVQVGKNTSSYINNDSAVTVKKDGAFGYNRLNDATTVEVKTPVTVEGGKVFNAGNRAIHLNNTKFSADGGTLENTGAGNFKVSTATNAAENVGVLKFSGKKDGDVVLNINTSKGAMNLAGLASLTNAGSVLNFTSSNRGNFLNLNGAMDSFRGMINISGNCWFTFNSGSALGSENAVWNTSMTQNSGILFENGGLNGKTVKMGDLTGNGWVRPGNLAGNGSGLTLEVGALGNDSTFSGALRDNVGPDGGTLHLSVVKVGDGTWTFASNGQVSGVDYNNTADITVKEGTLVLNRNAGQTSAAALTIDGGTLVVSNNNQTISGAMKFKDGKLIVADGSSLSKVLTLGADAGSFTGISGKIVGNTTVAAGTFSPTGTASDIGTLTNEGNLTFRSGTTILIDAQGNAANDRIIVDGKLIMEEGAKIAFSDDIRTDLDVFTLEIIDADSYEIAGVIPDMNFNWDVLLADPQHWSLSLIDGTLVAESKLPEPSAWLLLLFGAACLYWQKKRTAAC